jgi:hypothetical protein
MSASPNCWPLLTTLRIAGARYHVSPYALKYPFTRSNSSQALSKNAFANTLLLPKTNFPLWANPAQREVPYRHKTTEELYKWQVSIVNFTRTAGSDLGH